MSVEPPIGESNARWKANGDAPTWYDAQDLEVLKAWSNEILEVQAEISMFGSLKTFDVCILSNRRLTTPLKSCLALAAQQQVNSSSGLVRRPYSADRGRLVPQPANLPPAELLGITTLDNSQPLAQLV